MYFATGFLTTLLVRTDMLPGILVVPGQRFASRRVGDIATGSDDRLNPCSSSSRQLPTMSSSEPLQRFWSGR